MDVTNSTDQSRVVSPGTGKTFGLTETCTIKVNSNSLTPEIETAAEPRDSMPTKLLRERIGKAIGIGGLFRALWNYISNSSTKSLDQAKLDVIDQEKLKEVAKDYLKDNLGDVDAIMREITSNTESRDPRIVQAFAEALKEIDQEKFDNLSAAVKSLVDGVLEKGAQTPSAVTPGNIKHAADLVDKLKSVIGFSQPALALHSLAQKLSTDKITPELIRFCKNFPGLAQKLPAEQITPDLIAFCKNFPEQAQALAERQDLHRMSFRGTSCNDGLVLMYDDKGYKPEILNLINPELFGGDGQDDQIKSFLENPAVKSNLFWVDGLNRWDVPHITLPNGVEILSNKWCDSSEYCKSTGEPYDQAKYLKHMLDKFKDAYKSPDEAVRAFKVFVQNFTGVGNTLANTVDSIIREKTDGDILSLMAMVHSLLVNTTFNKYRSQPTMRMDECFNINLNVTACMSDKESIQELNKTRNTILKATGDSSSFREDTIFGIAVSSYIPAVESDTMDQRGQEGRQTTTFGIIESLGNKDSN
jgi:hypothetical protein